MFDEKRIEDDNNINSNHHHQPLHNNDNNSSIDDCHMDSDLEQDQDMAKEDNSPHLLREDDKDGDIINLVSSDATTNFLREVSFYDDNDGDDGDMLKSENFDFDDSCYVAMLYDDIGNDSNPATSTSGRCGKVQPALRIDLKNINEKQSCLPLPENCSEPTKKDDNNTLKDESSSPPPAAVANATEAPTTTAIAGEEQNNLDSCSSATTATTVINTYCLSPNSTDNEPTTPTLATTINDIIFQISEDSMDKL